MRVGIGYDIHRTAKGRKLMLGGVLIPSDMGSLGHSDADVLIHAICDAILGALGKPDIGEHFPDTDPKYKGISSAILLKKVGRIARKNGYAINNLDSTVILEKPRLSPFKNRIRETIAEILNISPAAVNVKAKTNEGLGDIGKNNAVVAYAIVSLTKL
jgi:2-C-methyl-D-erythritol 2,4-cyclodiphosphate synthase